jgi:hypothetical protein
MIPEVGSYNEKPTKINFGWFFYFFLTLKSKLLEWAFIVSLKKQKGLFHDPRGGFLQRKTKPKKFWLVFLFLPHSQK